MNSQEEVSKKDKTTRSTYGITLPLTPTLLAQWGIPLILAIIGCLILPTIPNSLDFIRAFCGLYALGYIVLNAQFGTYDLTPDGGEDY